MTASRNVRPRSAGFTFIEILVVMGIIAVLVGLGISVFKLAAKKAPEVRTASLLGKMRANIDLWRGVFKTYPPADLTRLPLVTGMPLKLGKPVPNNTTNVGIESLVQCLLMPGYDQNPDLDADFCNTDDDKLDKALAKSGDPALYEVKDAWGNPLVYIVEGDYAAFEKDPPTYVNGRGEAVNPKPYRNAQGTHFAQPNAYQLYSMGPDGLPNTEDDVKTWESD